MSKYKIRITNLSIVKDESILLDSQNIDIKPSSISIIAGSSGSGKTSILRIINRLDEPSGGNILYNGVNIKDIDIIKLRKSIVLVPQIPTTFNNTVKDNLLIQSKLGITPYPSDDIIIKTLNICGLDKHYMDKNAENLSLGEKQRVCIARSIINKPDVLLLDEPTSSLDIQNSQAILKLITDLNNELGITIIMVTHKIEQSKMLSADYYTLNNKQLTQGIID